MEDIDMSSLYSQALYVLRQLMIVINILSRLHVNAALVLNTCTSWHETMLVPILLNQK